MCYPENINVMKTKIITIKLVLLFLLSGCSDVLDVSPYSQWKLEEFYKNETEVKMALAGIYSQLTTDGMYGYGFNVLLEGGTDESYTNNTTASWNIARLEITPSDDLIKNVWTQLYSCIQLVNLFEKNMDASSFSEADYNRYLAKARFYRAFCYMHLANWWGDVPLRLTPSKQQSDNHVPASPVLKVYEQAEKDFLFAVKHLYHANDAKYVQGEPNLMAARGLLARLYLKMGGYQPYLSENENDCYFPNNSQYFQKALNQCDTIIYKDGWHNIVPYATDPLSYKNHFLNYIQDRYDTKESLFEISFGYLSNQGISVSGRMGNTNGVSFTGTSNIPRSFAQINASIVLYDLYMSNPDDTRKDWNIAGYKNVFTSSINGYRMAYVFNTPLNEKYGPGKFRRWEPKDLEALKNAPNGRIDGADYTILNNGASATDPNFTSINFPILRYPDVLLMYAEAAIGGRNGNTPASAEALECLNKVRNRAGLGDFTNADHDAFFNELTDERLRELCFEGLRKQDLIRWGLYETRLAYTATSIKNNAAYNPNDSYQRSFLGASTNFDRTKHLTLPYPLQEVEINNSLMQKTRWR